MEALTAAVSGREVLLWGISFGTAIVTAVSGAGGGVLLLALMGTLLPAAWVVPLHGAVMTGTNFSRAVLLWRQVNPRLVLSVAAGSLLGALLIGPWVMEIPAMWMELVLGVGLLWLVWAPKAKGEMTWLPDWLVRWRTLLLGMLTSMVSMLIGGAGMLFAAVLQRQNLPKTVVMANQSVCMMVQHSLKTFTFFMLGFAFGPHLPLVAGMIAMGWLGTWVGTRWLHAVPQAMFNRIFKWVVTVLAVRMLWLVVAG